MNRSIGLVMAAIVVLSAGCASVQRPIPLSIDALSDKPAKIGVVLSRVPKPDTQFPGAACLLCLAAASVMNSSLTTYTGTLPADELSSMPQEIAGRLRARGIEARAIDERIDVKTLPGAPASGNGMPPKDFRALGAKYGVDKLIVLEVAVLGFERTYSSYVPTSDPKGFVYGAGYMVDLPSNRYEWYEPVRVMKSADGAWDEPPKYPGLTNAFFQALEMSKDRWLEPFESK